MVDFAYVRIWDTLVGVVAWDEESGVADFQYDKNFIALGWDISPIKMPIDQGDRVYRFPELLPVRDSIYDTFMGLPGLLADSLPDRYGNRLIERWLAENGRPAESMNPVEKLCFIGSRGMGALEFEPAKLGKSKNTFAVELDSLVEMAKRMLDQRQGFSTTLNKEEQQAMQEILKIGTSAGGARPKAVIAYNPSSGEVRSGQTRVPKGFEHWLIKLDGVSGVQFGQSHGWGRVEYAYHLMALECGIEMTRCELLEEHGRAHFMTLRFDREGVSEKHHIQTLCGIQHYDYNDMNSYSYEQVFQTMRLLRLTYPEAEEMFRRMVFNVLASNCDDHTKNFSFRMKKDEHWELAPAYDLCFAYDPTSKWVNQQSLSVSGKHSGITKADLMNLARTNNIKKGEQIIDHISQVVTHWQDFAGQAGVSDELRRLIQENLHLV